MWLSYAVFTGFGLYATAVGDGAQRWVLLPWLLPRGLALGGSVPRILCRIGYWVVAAHVAEEEPVCRIPRHESTGTGGNALRAERPAAVRLPPVDVVPELHLVPELQLAPEFENLLFRVREGALGQSRNDSL